MNPRNHTPAQRLPYSFARAQLGEDVWESGDRDGLMEARVFLGEGERSSNCSFLVWDPQQFWAQKYFAASYAAGGLYGLGPPPNASADAGGTAGLGPSESIANGDAAKHELLIVREALRQGVRDKGQIAYMLATAFHETDRFNTLEEYASGAQYEGRSDLGNTQPGDGVRFKGRGYAQLTGRVNYQKYSRKLGVDLIANPEKVEEPNIAAYVLVDGSLTGHFTGVRLGQYVSGSRQDFVNARQVINGLDRASLIAGYARDYLGRMAKLIEQAGGNQPQAGKSAQDEVAQNDQDDNPTPKQADAPNATQADAPANTGGNTLTTEAPPTETAEKGQEITITLGFDQASTIEYTFIHTGTKHQMHLNATEFTGQCVRWVLTRRIKNSTYQNITLKELAEQVGQSYGLRVECPENGPTYEHLDQTGITDYQLLRRECERIGWRLLDREGVLIVEPRTTGDEAFLLEYGWNIASFSCEDRAQTDAANGRASASNTGETKAIVETSTGELKQIHAENKGATGAQGGAVSTVQTVAAELARDQVDPNITAAARVNAAGQVTIDNGPTSTTASPIASTGAAAAPVQGKLSEDSEVTEEDAATGSDNAKRVKGFPASVSAVTTPAMLQVTPDTPVRTDGFLADFLNRVWICDHIEHRWDGVLRSAMKLYTPMRPKFNVTGGGGATQAAAGQIVNPPKGKLANPFPGAARGTPFDPAGTIRGRPHRGIDMAKDANPSTMIASFAGKVIDVQSGCVVGDRGCGGGFGNLVEIAGEGEWEGYSILYAHLSSVAVTNGQRVQAGQAVGIEGNSGSSGGLHLHFELRKNGSPIDPEPYLDPCPTETYGQGANTPLRCGR